MAKAFMPYYWLHNPTEKSVSYYWLHIPTGNKGKSYFDNALTASRASLLERINSWNRQKPGVWQYWMEA